MPLIYDEIDYREPTQRRAQAGHKIMHNFNFEKVHKLMTAKSLIVQAIQFDTANDFATGGFTAMLQNNTLSLKFVSNNQIIETISYEI